MAVLRYILLGVSALGLALILMFWTIGGRSGDLVVFLVMAFLIANSAYILFSRPTLKASTVFDRAATGLAFASLELQHQATEAKIREVDAARVRAEEAARSTSKLKAAEEFISYVRQNPLMRRRHAVEVKQITLRNDANDLPFPALEMPRAGQSEMNGRLRADPGAAVMMPPAPPASALPRLES